MSKKSSNRNLHTVLITRNIDLKIISEAFLERRPIAIEKLCLVLADELDRAKTAGAGAALALREQMMLPHEINSILVQLLMALRRKQLGNYPMLMHLVSRQLGVDPQFCVMGYENPTRTMAERKVALILAAFPKMGSRVVARLSRVSPSRVNEWKKLPSLQARISTSPLARDERQLHQMLAAIDAEHTEMLADQNTQKQFYDQFVRPYGDLTEL